MDDLKPVDEPIKDNSSVADSPQDNGKEISKMPINQDRKVIYINFDDTQKEELKQLIEKAMARMHNALDEKGFYDALDDLKEKYNAEHKEEGYPVSGNYDIVLPIQKLVVGVLVDMAIKQCFQVDPLVLMEREGPISDDDLHIRQNKLNFTVRNKLRFEEVCRAIFEHAIYEPVCITETLDFFDEERFNTTIETYQPTPEGIAKYEKDFGLINDEDSLEYQNRLLLGMGQAVTVPVTGSKVIYDGPKVTRVDNEKFFADPNQKDFRKMRVHGKEVDLSWADVEMRANSEKYNWDKDAVEKIKKMWADDKSKTIPFFEMVVLFDKDKKDETRRYVITMEARSREIVRSILHTEEEMQYDSHSINPKDDSWIGESLLVMINEIAAVIQSNLNYMLYSNDLAHTPIIMTDDPDAITRRGIDLGVVNAINVGKGSTMQQLTFGNTGFDRMSLVASLFDLLYIFCGVNVPTLSGGMQAKDPRAGVGKTALTTQVANLRIENMITRLLYGVSKVVEKVEKIMYKNEANLDYYDGNKLVKVPKSIYQSPVRYIMNGSKMSFNPEMDLNAFAKFMQIASGIVPEILKIDEVRRELLEIVIQDIGGSISKRKEELVKYMDSFIKVKKEMEKKKQEAMGKGQPGAQPTDKPIPETTIGAGSTSIPDSGSAGVPQGGAPAASSGATAGGVQ
jgi:hypothetical protein